MQIKVPDVILLLVAIEEDKVARYTVYETDLDGSPTNSDFID
jgi:hypothetical protein